MRALLSDGHALARTGALRLPGGRRSLKILDAYGTVHSADGFRGRRGSRHARAGESTPAPAPPQGPSAAFDGSRRLGHRGIDREVLARETEVAISGTNRSHCEGRCPPRGQPVGAEQGLGFARWNRVRNCGGGDLLSLRPRRSRNSSTQTRSPARAWRGKVASRTPDLGLVVGRGPRAKEPVGPEARRLERRGIPGRELDLIERAGTYKGCRGVAAERRPSPGKSQFRRGPGAPSTVRLLVSRRPGRRSTVFSTSFPPRSLAFLFFFSQRPLLGGDAGFRHSSRVSARECSCSESTATRGAHSREQSLVWRAAVFSKNVSCGGRADVREKLRG